MAEGGDIVCHYRTGPQDCSASDADARQNGHPVTNPYVIADCNGLFLLEPLLHHGYVITCELVVPRDDGHILPHHHIAANDACPVYFCIDADTGMVSENYMRRKDRICLDIDVFATACKHEATT